MRIVTKSEMAELPAGTMFAEYDPKCDDVIASEVEVKVFRTFGATSLVPALSGEMYTWDWALGEYTDDEKFLVFEKPDIENMIVLLQGALYAIESKGD